ncbi:MAG: hypothetical protein ABI600_18700 [Luteolibacter sp.]
MSPIALIFFLLCAGALIGVPIRWAPVPLLLGCTYMTFGQGIHVGSISLPIYRMLLLVGVARTIIKGERLPGGFNLIDKLMIAWGGWVIFAGLFHDQTRAGPVTAAGEVFNISLPYFLIRIWCTDLQEIGDVIRIIALLMVPIMCEMAFEKATGRDLFAIFGGVPEHVLIREGKLRAQGPFRHPILAGTVGATCIPLFIGILREHRTTAIIGIVSGIVITFASASSGPVMSLITGLFALVMWRWKHLAKPMRYGAVLLYIVLMFTMSKPPYYLISKIDLSGGSTGWHRSFLIQQTIAYFNEWWLFGTDFTRHWMPNQGFANDPNHTDITNYYIGFGVSGGFAAMLLMICMMGCAFRWVGQIQAERFEKHPDQSFMIWCFGACLFSHSINSLSVAYFDQSMLYFWLSVAVISSTYSVVRLNQETVEFDPISLETDDEGEADSLDDPETITRTNAEWRRKLWERAAARMLENSTNNP